MRQRKNAKNLLPAEISALQTAVRALQGSRDLKANYTHFAQMHVHSCQHGCELFLPRHRAYILDYEDALRKAAPGLTLPYWDWVGTPGIPDIFTVVPLDHPAIRGAEAARYQLPARSPSAARSRISFCSEATAAPLFTTQVSSRT